MTQFSEENLSSDFSSDVTPEASDDTNPISEILPLSCEQLSDTQKSNLSLQKCFGNVRPIDAKVIAILSYLTPALGVSFTAF